MSKGRDFTLGRNVLRIHLKTKEYEPVRMASTYILLIKSNSSSLWSNPNSYKTHIIANKDTTKGTLLMSLKNLPVLSLLL